MSETFGTNPGDPANAAVIGGVGERLDADQVTGFVHRCLAGPTSTPNGCAWSSRTGPGPARCR